MPPQPENPFEAKLERDMFTGKLTREAPPIPPIMLLIAIPFILIGSVFMIPIFPVAATIAALAGFLVATVFGVIYDWSAGDFSRWTLMAVVMLVALFCALPLEGVATRRFRRYRQMRHWIRVGGLALMINEIGLSMVCGWLNIYQTGRAWGLWDGVTLTKLVRIAILALCVHVIFRLLDTRRRGLQLRERLGAPGLAL